MTDEKCEKCGSTNGFPHYCSGFGCGIKNCGELKYFSCKDCGHMTSFYHITELGKQVLEILLDPIQTCSDTATEDVDLCDKGAFDYCGDGPPRCEYLCIRRSSNQTAEKEP